MILRCAEKEIYRLFRIVPIPIFHQNWNRAMSLSATAQPVPLRVSRLSIAGLLILSFCARQVASAPIRADLTSRQIDVGERLACDVAVGPDGSIYLFHYRENAIRRFDPDTGALLGTIDVGRSFDSGQIVGESLFAVGTIGFNPALTTIDLTTSQITATHYFPPPRDQNGSHRGHVLLSPDGDRVYAKMGNNSTLFVVDAHSREIIESPKLFSTSRQLALSTDGDYLYTLDGGGNKNGYLVIFDARTYDYVNSVRFVSRFDSTPHDHSLAINPVTGEVYAGFNREGALNQSDFEVVTFDSIGQSTGTIDPAHGFGNALGISKDGSLIVAGHGEVYNVATGELVADLAAGVSPSRVRVTDGGRAYIANYNSDFLTIIEGLPIPEPLAISLTVTALPLLVSRRMHR
jgi:glutamine cyclotransferase